MKDDEPILGNIAKGVLTEGYFERAQARSRASKTWWDLIFMPIGFGFIALFWIGLWRTFWLAHVALVPADAARFKPLMSGSMTFAQFLMMIVPIFAAIPLGFLASNSLMWLVPWARRASEKKAEGVKWASFRGAQTGLFKIALILLPIGLVSGLLGAFLLGR